LTKEEGRDIIVLELNDVVDDCCHSPTLVVSKSLINGVPVIKFLVFFSTFVKFISVENGVLRGKVTFILV